MFEFLHFYLFITEDAGKWWVFFIKYENEDCDIDELSIRGEKWCYFFFFWFSSIFSSNPYKESKLITEEPRILLRIQEHHSSWGRNELSEVSVWQAAIESSTRMFRINLLVSRREKNEIL